MKKQFQLLFFSVTLVSLNLRAQYIETFDTIYNTIIENQVQTVHSVYGSSIHGSFKEIVHLGKLPPNCIYWQCFVGVGNDAQEIFNKAKEKADRTRTQFASASKVASYIPVPQAQLLSIALSYAANSNISSKAERIKYYFVKSLAEAENFKSGYSISPFDAGEGPLLSKRYLEPTDGDIYLCLENIHAYKSKDIHIKFLTVVRIAKKSNLEGDRFNRKNLDNLKNENIPSSDGTNKQANYSTRKPLSDISLNELNSRLAKILDDMSIPEEQKKGCKDAMMEHQIKVEEIQNNTELDEGTKKRILDSNTMRRKSTIKSILGAENYEIFLQKRKTSAKTTTQPVQPPQNQNITNPSYDKQKTEKEKFVESVKNSCVAAGISGFQQDSTINLYLEYWAKLDKISKDEILTNEDKEKYLAKFRKKRSDRLKLVIGEEKLKLFEQVRKNTLEAEKNRNAYPTRN